jgi:anti-sigma B factor antagonist
MTLTSRTVDRIAVLDLAGRLTSTDGTGLLKAAVDRLIAEGHKSVVLNLSQLSYMDSGGLGEMISCHSAASRVGGSIKLAHTTEKIQDLLSITKLITVFDTFDTEQLALDSFAVAVPVAVPAHVSVAKA